MMLPLLVLAVLPTIWIVDASGAPGTNFTDLPPAVAAAVSGDTILVRPGSYTPFNVTGKALTIRGAGASTTAVEIPVPVPAAYGETRIGNVPAGSVFYLSGIRFTPYPPPQFPPGTAVYPVAGLILSGPGQIVLADVVVQGTIIDYGLAGVGGIGGLSVSNGPEVHASRCQFSGGAGNTAPAGTGASIGAGCKLAADNSTFTGGTAFTSLGAHGLVVGGLATLSRCSAYGGGGGTSSGSGIYVVGGAGFLRVAGTAASVIQGGARLWTSGSAISASSGSSAVVHGSVTLLTSAGSPVTSGAVTVGAAPLPHVSLNGTPTAGGELMASQPVTGVLEGLIPFAPFALAIDLAPSFSTGLGPLFLGELLVSPAPAAILQGNLDAAGMFQATVTPAISAPQLTGAPLYLQCGVLDAAGQVRLSNSHIRILQ
jgi:hypothetical protein